MIRSLLAALDRLIFVRPLLARDAEGKYVSPAGRAYRVTVEPQPGAENAILVMLHGAPCVPNTFLNHLQVRVEAQPAAIDAAIRELLSRADAAEARFAAVRASFDWEAVTTPPSEEEALPAGLREAVLTGGPWSAEPAEFETKAGEE